MRYIITFSFDIGKAVPAVGALANELNTSLSTAGCDEKLSIRGDLPSQLVLTSGRKLTQMEQSKMKEIIGAQMRQSFPEWDVRVSSFRRKSGKVQQQAA